MRKSHHLDGILAMVLFGLFAGTVLMVLMMGAQSYQKVVAIAEEGYDAGICLQYMATKTAHYSGDGAVSVVEFGDGSALALKENLDGCDYVTYLYCHDGQMKELFCQQDVTLGPEAGFSVMAVEALSVETVAENLLRLSCTEQGQCLTLYVHLHQG